MRRVIWFGLGIAVTVVAAGYVARTHERFKMVSAVSSPAGIGEQVGQLAVAVRDVADEFRRSMAEHEENLTQALLGEPADTPAGSEQLHSTSRRNRRHNPPQPSTQMEQYDSIGEDLEDLDRYL